MYLVKWCGYANSENTWELASNIRGKLLDDFEALLLQPTASAATPRCEGLRQNRKVVHRQDYMYVLNM